jgi:hypothetical protein
MAVAARVAATKPVNTTVQPARKTSAAAAYGQGSLSKELGPSPISITAYTA